VSETTLPPPGGPPAARCSARSRGAGALLLVALLVAAAGARCAGWERWSLWLDETIQVHYARQTMPEMIRRLTSEDAHPPLDYLVTRAVRRFSEADAALRAPALLWGTATVAALFFGAGGLARPRRSFATAAAFAVLPAAVHFGQEIRPYSLALLLVATADWARRRFAESGRTGWLALHFAAGVLAAYTLYLALAALAVSWTLEAAEAWTTRRRDPRRWRAALLLPAAVGVAFAPWLASLERQAIRPPVPLDPEVTMGLVARYAAGLLTGAGESERWLAALAVAAFAAVGLFALRGWERWRTAIELGANFAAPLAALSYSDHWWNLRYVLMATLPLARALGAGIEALADATPPRWRGAALPAAGALLLACQAPALAANRLSARVDWRPPARYLAEQFAAGRGGAVYAVEGWGYFVMRFQLGRLSPPIWLDRILGTPEELDVAMKSAGAGWVVRAPRFGGGFRVDPLLAEATPWARFPEAEDGTLYRFEAGRFVAPPAASP
jgi:hypothetical protein